MAVDLITLAETSFAQQSTYIPVIVDADAVYDGYTKQRTVADYTTVRRLDRQTGTVTQSKPMLWPVLVATDATSLYFVSDFKLQRVPKTDVAATPVVLATLPTSRVSKQEFISFVDGSDLVYTTYGTTSFGRVPLTGGAVKVTNTGKRLANLIADDTHYYFLADSATTVTRWDLWSIPK